MKFSIETQLWMFEILMLRLRCILRSRLVGVREATHAGHDAEDVVVERVDADLRGAAASDRVE